ncbi:MAG TPA: tail fiber protein [Terracidiphilus sp.]|nr:tail fiber protein [Terracidiphilus sp.]
MSEPFLGEIRMVGFNFAPVGWFLCNGQTLSISQYTALFSLLGTTFGGNGTTTFMLPNLQGRVPVCVGNGVGLAPYVWGQMGGSASASILTSNLPVHTHAVTPPVSNANATASSPVNGYPAVDVTTISGGQRGETAATMSYAAASVPGQNAAAYQTGAAGGGVPISVEPPYLAVYFIIAYNGIFPSRS